MRSWSRFHAIDAGFAPCGARGMAESAVHLVITSFDVRDRALDYRAVIATAAIEVTVELL